MARDDESERGDPLEELLRLDPTILLTLHAEPLAALERLARLLRARRPGLYRDRPLGPAAPHADPDTPEGREAKVQIFIRRRELRQSLFNPKDGWAIKKPPNPLDEQEILG